MLFRLPGVYRPQRDTWLLAEVLASRDLGPGTRVLDLCCGTGALSMQACAAGAGWVTAVDVSRRAALSTWLNAKLNGRTIRVVRGDLVDSVRTLRFDVIVVNPPYAPAADDGRPGRVLARAWDAGVDGRAVLDRICIDAPDLLAPGGTLLLVQSTLNGVDKTRTMLEERGLRVDVVASESVPFGPALSSRTRMLENRDMIRPGQRIERIAVLAATDLRSGTARRWS
ncbi:MULTISPECIES: HemK2/MTQ2 family protein methyltransferase [unclassified Rhodococcus (in: high G+C Gram-positive bacteria)]|uniref:HemK2/MTQ2 family protein methyltransferase n=1 Tax=unclassified Rhodococcus (in: high G+C Gram-positive bacteria) TaxID=192944 RepID=UPI0016399A1D|nr:MULTISPECIES: HemK2/MTQ2 family protein methyltransferase [unclassified Rhodococcus (in: high G+C Gram-positive bacteria)]MBC2643844.1 methyltransferase [Rhodococcus sp. 3A]MBC2891415.1 methyltransferase [Rhodococcus sp. 4CII]